MAAIAMLVCKKGFAAMAAPLATDFEAQTLKELENSVELRCQKYGFSISVKHRGSKLVSLIPWGFLGIEVPRYPETGLLPYLK
jgi:hypothetical protein